MQIYRDLYGDVMLEPIWMCSKMAAGNQQKHLSLSCATKAYLSRNSKTLIKITIFLIHDKLLFLTDITALSAVMSILRRAKAEAEVVEVHKIKLRKITSSNVSIPLVILSSECQLSPLQ